MKLRDMSKPITAKSLNESLAKRFGEKINLEQFTLEQLENVRNKLRTELSQAETNESFDSYNTEEYQKQKLYLDVLNAEVSERAEARGEETDESMKFHKKNLRGKAKRKYKEAGEEKEHPLKGTADELAAEPDLNKAKEMAVNAIQAMGMDPKKEAKFLGSINKSRNVMNIVGLMYNMILSSEGNSVVTSKWGSNEGMREDGNQEGTIGDFKAAIDHSAKQSGLNGQLTSQQYKQAYSLLLKGGKSVNDAIIFVVTALVNNNPESGLDIRNVDEKLDDLINIVEQEFQDIYYDNFPDTYDNEGIEESTKDNGMRKSPLRRLFKEGEEDKAELIMASKDMVDRLTGWMEDTAEMQTESMLDLADAIRDELGQEQSDAFTMAVKPALEQLYAAMEQTRVALIGGVGLLTGEGGNMNMMGADDDMGGDELDMEPTTDMDGAEDELSVDVDDEFGGAPAADGGEDPAGREKRESRENRRKMIESSRRIGALLSRSKKK
jgi:hypothetical protein